MNKLVLPLTLALFAGSHLAALGQTNLQSDPAYLPIDKALDLQTIQPQVNINLPRFLLKDVVPELNGVLGSRSGDKGIDFADLIKDVKLIRVVVVEANDTNRAALKKGVKTLRAELEGKWTPIVSVAEEESVGVYAMSDPAGESLAGIAVLVHDGDNAVIVNVVGNVSIGKMIKLASQMDKMPKDLMKKLQSFSAQTNTPPASGDDSKAIKPAQSPEAPVKEPAAK